MNKVGALDAIKKITEIECDVKMLCSEELYKNLKIKFDECYNTIQEMYTLKDADIDKVKTAVTTYKETFFEMFEYEKPEKPDLSRILYRMQELMNLESETIYYICLYQPNSYSAEHYKATELVFDIADMIADYYKVPKIFLRELTNRLHDDRENKVFQELIRNESSVWYNGNDKIGKHRINPSNKNEFISIDDIKNSEDPAMAKTKAIFKKCEEDRLKEIEENPYQLKAGTICFYNMTARSFFEKYSAECELYKDETIKDNYIGYFKDFSNFGCRQIKNEFEKEKTRVKIDGSYYCNIKNIFNCEEANLDFDKISALLSEFPEFGLNGVVTQTEESWKGHGYSDLRKLEFKIKTISLREGFTLLDEDMILLRDYLKNNEIKFKSEELKNDKIVLTLD